MRHLELTDVKKFYRRNLALDIAYLLVGHGDRIVVWGGNGSGKSTLLRILAGFSTPTSGQFVRSPELVGMRIGYVPQAGGIYEDLTFRQNIQLYRLFYGLPEEHSNLSDTFLMKAGLDEFLDVTVGDLSGGLRHAATLACVLDVAPDALLLDEPESDLDSRRREALRSELARLTPSLSFLVMSSHTAEMPPFVEREITLERGKIL